MSRPLSLFSVQAILVLAVDDGSRILTKYYSNPHPPAGNHGDYPGQIAYKTVKDQKAFEKGLLGTFFVPALSPPPSAPADPPPDKTAKQTTDIILYDGKIVVFKMESDVMLYVVGSAEENEVLLYRSASASALAPTIPRLTCTSVVLALRDSLNILLK
jgi:hypothetical protein